MNIINIKVFITKTGDGAISYTKDKKNFKVFLSRDDIIIKDIFNSYFKDLKSFKERHYAIAKWIARDIRDSGYVFKAYSNNHCNIRPVRKRKRNSIKSYKTEHQYFLYELHFQKYKSYESDLGRLMH